MQAEAHEKHMKAIIANLVEVCQLKVLAGNNQEGQVYKRALYMYHNINATMLNSILIHVLNAMGLALVFISYHNGDTEE